MIVVEDTDITPENLVEYGYDSDIIDALKLMTHDKSVPYMDYVREIKKNPIATKVKKTDLDHNSDITRLDTVDDKARVRAEKYKQAVEILNS